MPGGRFSLPGANGGDKAGAVPFTFVAALLAPNARVGVVVGIVVPPALVGEWTWSETGDGTLLSSKLGVGVCAREAGGGKTSSSN